MAKYWFARAPWDYHETYWTQSPLSRVGRIATSTTVIVGEEDTRTPPGEAEQLCNALMLRRIPTILVRVRDASHGSMADHPSQLVAEVPITLAWFGRYRR